MDEKNKSMSNVKRRKNVTNNSNTRDKAGSPSHLTDKGSKNTQKAPKGDHSPIWQRLMANTRKSNQSGLRKSCPNLTKSNVTEEIWNIDGSENTMRSANSSPRQKRNSPRRVLDVGDLNSLCKAKGGSNSSGSTGELRKRGELISTCSKLALLGSDRRSTDPDDSLERSDMENIDNVREAPRAKLRRASRSLEDVALLSGDTKNEHGVFHCVYGEQPMHRVSSLVQPGGQPFLKMEASQNEQDGDDDAVENDVTNLDEDCDDYERHYLRTDMDPLTYGRCVEWLEGVRLSNEICRSKSLDDVTLPPINIPYSSAARVVAD